MEYVPHVNVLRVHSPWGLPKPPHSFISSFNDVSGQLAILQEMLTPEIPTVVSLKMTAYLV